MKKVIISILIVLLLILGYFMVVTGMKFGDFQIFGIVGLNKKNSAIDSKISTASSLTSTQYPKVISDINTNAKQLVKSKQDYEDLTKYSGTANTEQGIERQTYEIEFLYKVIGTYATKEGVKIDMNIVTATTPTSADGRKLFDINFTGNGPYVGIALFISAIENDSDLQFKIENFKMVEVNGVLQATFSIKNIPINIAKITEKGTTATSDQTNNTNTNTTNSTGNTVPAS